MSEVRLQKMDIGDRFETPKRIISKTDAELYVSMTGDIHPIFLDDEYAKNTNLGFEGAIVPGLLTYSYAVGLMIQCGLLKDVLAYMGTENMRFLKPVYPYDSVSVEVELISKKEVGKGIICSYNWWCKNQKGEVVIEGVNT